MIYGIDEVDNAATGLSFVDGSKYTTDWLENVIDGNIQQKIEGLKIFPVRFDDDIRKTVFVIKVPRSDNAPHIASTEKRYYRRYNFKSVPMEEYEIRNLYFAARDTEVVIERLFLSANEPFLQDGFYDYKLEVIVKNSLNILAEKYKVVANLKNCKFCYINAPNHHISQLANFEVSISSTNSIPLYPQEEFTALSFNLKVRALGVRRIIRNIEFDLYVFNPTNKIESDVNVNSLLIKLFDIYNASDVE